MHTPYDTYPLQLVGQVKPKSFVIDFPFGPAYLMAGPYWSRPDDMLGVKLAAELSDECAISLPIPDFSVPKNRKEVDAALYNAIALLAEGRTLYVGCWGGKGRTGLFLALLVKVALQAKRRWWHFGIEDPVSFTRKLYRQEAVETPKQEAYVRSYNVKAIAKALNQSNLFVDKRSRVV